MIRLYITRHGQTEWNIEKRMQGWCDSKLTEMGRKNAAALGEKLKNVEFNAIYASPLDRTMNTAQLIRGNREVEIIPEPAFMEINLASWEGMTTDEIEKEDPVQFRNFWDNPQEYFQENGESFEDVQKRALRGIERIIKEQTEGNVLVATHTVVIKTLLAHFKGLNMNQLWDPPFIHDTCLSIIELEGDEARLVLEADMSHTA